MHTRAIAKDYIVVLVDSLLLKVSVSHLLLLFLLINEMCSNLNADYHGCKVSYNNYAQY